MGFYGVPAGPHPTVRCEDRSTLWQLRFPAAEQTLTKHYSEDSTPGKTLKALRYALAELRTASGSCHVISDYMLKTLLWWRLEEEASSVAATMRLWTHDNLALHVLTLMDRLVLALRSQKLDSYFFSWFNVMLNCPGGGSLHYTEEDYSEDADVVACYVRRLSENMWSETNSDQNPWLKMEAALVVKWTDVLSDLTPPLATRSRRLSFTQISSSGYSAVAASQYSMRQLDYIGQILRSVLKVRSFTLSKVNGLPLWTDSSVKDAGFEDITYLLSTILDQAKQLSFGQVSKGNCAFKRKLRKKTKCQQDLFDQSVGLLLEQIKQMNHSVDLTDDNTVVREVLKWLYLALDKDSKVIGPVLRPYLAKLFTVSHENCWHMTEWKQRQNKHELEALATFCSLVLENKLSVNLAVIDAYNKGWCWAEKILKTYNEVPGGVELIFCPSGGSVVRHKLNLNTQLLISQSTQSLGRNPERPPQTLFMRPSKPLKEFLQMRLESSQKESEISVLSHNILKNSSPGTVCCEGNHRYGSHRGLGTIVHALLNLRKFTILQEVSSLLPEAERSQILDDIQQVSRELRRPRRAYHTISSRRDATYRTRGELSGAHQVSRPQSGTLRGTLGGTLIETCRVARKRQPVAAVTNPAFFEPPEPPSGLWLGAGNNTCLGLAHEMVYLRRSTKKTNIKRSDVVTKL